MIKKYILLFALPLIYFSLHSQTIDWSKKANPLLLSINGVAFSPDGQKILCGTDCHPAKIKIFDKNGNLDWDYTVGGSYMCIMGVTFSSNNQTISAIEEFGNIFLFDYSGNTPVIKDTIETGANFAFSTAISPDNNDVAVGCSDGKLRIYTIATGQLKNTLAVHANAVYSVIYSSDGQYIITCGADGKVKIWNNTGTFVRNISAHNAGVTAIKITADNKYIISSSKDHLIKVWEFSTGKLVQTFTGHSQEVTDIDLSPNEKMLVSSSADSTCKIWDFASGQQLKTFGVKDSGVIKTVAWSPNGNYIVSGNEKSDLVLWSIPQSIGWNTTQPFNDIFHIYPNPSQDILYIEKAIEKKIEHYIITDMTGRIICEFAAEIRQISLENLDAGLYIISAVNDGEKIYSKTILKMNP